MFHELIRDYIDRTIPPVNKLIATGISTIQLRKAPEIIDEQWRSVAKDFIPGLSYEGFRQRTPFQSFQLMSRRPQTGRGGKPSYDLARTNCVPYDFLFKYKGEWLDPRPIYVPYAEPYNKLYISGVGWTDTPVVTDLVFQRMADSVFVKLGHGGKGKFVVRRDTAHYLAGGHRQSVNVAHAMIHNKPESSRLKSVRAPTTLIHYVFCIYGVRETLRRFANAEVIIGDKDTVTKEKYGVENWVICEPLGNRPRAVKSFWEPSTLVVAVPIKSWNSQTKRWLGGLFYVAERFPERVVARDIDNTDLWRVLLGTLLWGNIHEGKAKMEINNHLESLGEYLSDKLAADLLTLGYRVSDFFDLLAVIVDNFNDWVANAVEEMASLWNKELSSAPHLLGPILTDINRAYYRLRNLSSADKEITARMLNDVLASVKTGAMYRVIKLNGELQVIQTSSDQPLMRQANTVTRQDLTNKGRHTLVPSSPANRIHASGWGSSMRAPSKADPPGKYRLSPWCNVGDDFIIRPNERHRELLMKNQEYFALRGRDGASILDDLTGMESNDV